MRTKRSLFTLALVWFLLGGLGACGSGPLPAKNWNQDNLAQIKVQKSQALIFAVLGDSRNNPMIFQQLLKQVDRDPEIAFAIHLGDMVEVGDLEKYRDFFKQVRENFHKPLLTVPGNHDVANHGRRLYQEIFGRYYYSFKINDHYFIMVDDAEQPEPDDQQLRWLEQELQKAQGCRTRLVFFHTPLFDPRGGSHHHCLPEERGRRLAALFQKYKVTQIFAGHIHSYFAGAWQGVPFTITAGGGAPLYGTDPEHFFFHYLKVTLQGDQVRIQVERLAPPESGRLDRLDYRVWLASIPARPFVSESPGERR